MMQYSLVGLRVAVLATDGFEESELTSPVAALKDAGALVEVVAPHKGEIQGMRHHQKGKRVYVDCALNETDPNTYDALVLPGGSENANALKSHGGVCEFISRFAESKKPIASICHGPLVLASCGFVKNRTLTSYPGIKDELIEAGAHWVDQEVVVDHNWVTSRIPQDLQAFNREFLTMLLKVPRSIAA